MICGTSPTTKAANSKTATLLLACCKYTARLVTYFCLIRGHVEMNLTIWCLEKFATLFFMTPQSQIEVINSNISIVFIIVSIIYLFIISTNHFSAPFWSWTNYHQLDIASGVRLSQSSVRHHNLNRFFRGHECT